MFGYIKPYQQELKVGEFDVFKAIYCGLCKELSSSFGPFASFTLSYDFTFLSLLAIGISDSCSGFKKKTCVANPLKKKVCLNTSDELSYCASTAMLMIYYKAKDDISDGNPIKKIMVYSVLPFLSSAKKGASKKFPKMEKVIANSIKSQDELEKKNISSIDHAAHPTSLALSSVFEELSNDPKHKLVLNRFGYLVGRYVYCMDALDDIEKDIKTGSYNPFVKKLQDENLSMNEIYDYAKQTVFLTIAQIPPAYELLEFKRYKPILDNIIYLGLKNQVDIILQKREMQNEKSI